QSADVDIGNAVAVSDHEGLPVEEGAKAADAATGVGQQAGVDQVNDPVLTFLVVNLNIAAGHIDGHAAVEVIIVEEIALDHIALVAEGNVELAEAVV